MFQLCHCNTEQYCILFIVQMHTFALAHFPHFHGIGRSSGKDIVSLCLASLLHYNHLLAVCSRTQVDQLTNFLEMENLTKHTIADMCVLCVAKYLMVSEEIFQDPVS